MNTIQGLPDESDYGETGDLNYINYRIDGYWLDEKLEELYPGTMYKGLIPTLTDDMMWDDEKAVVWKRILPEENHIEVCPILMCPDDNDFSCTLIVAEIKNCGDIVLWARIGIDKSDLYVSNKKDAWKVGTTVEWFDRLTEFTFNKVEYLAMLNNFRERATFDKNRE